jgi:hypothetical protein
MSNRNIPIEAYFRNQWQKEAREYYRHTFYIHNDLGHQIDHADDVYKNMAMLACKLKSPSIDYHIIFMCAYLHDIKVYENRKEHHDLAGDYVKNISDKYLKMFNSDELCIIENAVREHRASSVTSSSSIYSKILRIADKGRPDLQAIISRMVKSNKFPTDIKDSLDAYGEKIKYIIDHLKAKYSRTGYITNDTEYVEHYKVELEELWSKLESYSDSELGSLVNLITLSTLSDIM